MITKIIKRDGREVDFNINKIAEAIFKAARAVGGHNRELSIRLARQVVDTYERSNQFNDIPTVEEIQDIVEKTLIELGHARTAKAFILYRKQRKEIRNLKESILSIGSLIDDYIQDNDWHVRENSNMGYSLQGLNNHIATTITKRYWLEKVYPNEVSRAHLEGDIHIHDLGLLSVYCCGWDIGDLLKNGFTGVEGKIQSKPPRHFRTALGQIVNFFYTLQGEAAGAQALSNFDTYLAPYVFYDKLSYKEVKQAMQEFIFNLNVPTRVGFQTPFVNITMDLQCPKSLASLPAIVGGTEQDKKLGEFQDEIDLINKAFCEIMTEGDASGRIFTFPIPTYNITSDLNWENPMINRVMEMTMKYGLPYFSNFINSDLDPDDVRSMCCRLRLDNRELRRRGGGLFGAAPLTGSIGVVTINMPRIGYMATTKSEFLNRINELMNIACTSLEIKRKILENMTNNGLYPYAKFYLRNIKEQNNEYWSNHFNTIGLIGMHEALLNFMGKGIDTTEGKDFAIEVLDFMRNKLQDMQEQSGMMYNLEATPGEGTTYRLAKLDKKRYPSIITSGNDEPYYTNSTQLPVDYTEDIFTAFEMQEELQSRYTGGTVLHGFLGEAMSDIAVTKELIKSLATNFRTPYFTLSPTFSICPEHGHLKGEHFECPHCGLTCEVWSRVVGYYRPVQCWNNGKREEFKDRVEFVVAQ
ncbi:ribonucleoside triphosphate reductase [Clostridium sp. 'deep sea']|uniref:ribonucleoside triphosphate reductase n=1 Tax=Clostridium sp. 'deep sea' TaxID=2779445 RepID=UPI001A9A9387|nr:ribonucleoside triphosphate reductase [Clostridium sp. 'deep sea']